MKEPSSRAWVEVDLGALKRNGAALRSRTGAALLPMVKADAYGLGIAGILKTLLALDLWGLGVATLGEVEQLRALGYSGRMIIFTPLLESELDRALDLKVTPALGSPETVA